MIPIFIEMHIFLRYDLPNGFTDLQLGRDFINLFLFKYMPFQDDPPNNFSLFLDF